MSISGYVTDLDGYEGPIDAVVPYHFYMHMYWSLRAKWRWLLWDWTRREPCDASAALEPPEVVAGTRTTVRVTVTLGPTPLPQGGRAAVYLPLSYGGYANHNSLMCFQGPTGQIGYGARITAEASRDDVRLETRVHSTGSVFTCAEVIVRQGRLNQGDAITVVLGDPVCKPPMVCEKAKHLPLRVALDYAGDDTFRPVRPNPIVHVVGGQAQQLRCYAPASPPPDEPFCLRVLAADLINHNPAHRHEGRLTFEAVGPAAELPESASISADDHGSIEVPGVRLTGETDASVTRIRVLDETAGLMAQSNPICPAAVPEGLRLYYGEIHSHTELSDGSGTGEDNFHWAREVEGLDFAALADHHEHGQSYNYTQEEKWEITKDLVERFNEPGRFVTLLGYEIGTVEKHRNVYFADGEGRMIVEGRDGERVTMDNVFQKLAGTDYILIPHAPKFHGIDWHTPHEPGRQRLVEICSQWGVSEEGGYKSVRHALDLGYQFGFTGGTDNHVAEPGNPDQGGITGLLAPELSRRAVFDALMDRRTFATNGPRMILAFSVNGAFMGREISAEAGAPRRVRGRAITSDPIATVQIIRNGEVAFEQAGEGRMDVAVEWDDADPLADLAIERELTDARFAYYYLRVQTAGGQLGWASPIWVRPA